MIDIVNHIQLSVKKHKGTPFFLTKTNSVKRTKRTWVELSILCLKSNHIYYS
jgi:hypothetical protein